MPLFYADRVKQQIIASGNGLLTLSTPIASYIQFSNANIGANSFPYVIANSLQFEVGIGTFGTPGATGTTYGVIYRNTILSVSSGDTSPVNFNGSAAIVSISNAAELSVLVSAQPTPGTNKIIKWAGYEYELFDPIENGPSLGTSINNSVMYYNSATTNYDADANLKFFSGATPELFINGVIQATAKAFKIPHPVKAGKWLMHGCLEGPEYGIYLRGTEYFRFKKEIIFPEYFTKIAKTFNYSVIISSNCFTPIKVIKCNHKVIIKSLFPTIKNIEIDYMIIAERNDVEFNLEV